METALTRVEFASLKQRLLAAIIDFAFFVAIFLPVTYMVKGVWIMSPLDHNWTYGLFITDPLCILFLGIMVLYFVGFEAFLGQTLGKMIMGIKIINGDGSSPGFRRSMVRNLLRIVDSLPTLYLAGMYLIVRSKQNQRFGDKKADTIVVKKKSLKQ